MTCIPIKNGVVCIDDAFANLAPYGVRAWVSFHKYCGPTFYRSKNCTKPIMTPSKKTWDAFGKWIKERTQTP